MTRRIIIAVVLLVAAVALQTTLFADLRPLNAAPALALLTLIGVSRHLREDAALLVAFGTGIFLDLLGESPLGLWALVCTCTAFVIIKLRDRSEDDPLILAFGVFLLTAGALTLFSVLGTIFGEKTLADTGIVRKIVLPAVYNTVLAGLVLPAVTWVLGIRRRSGWDL